MIEARIQQEDLYFYEIMKNPALSIEFIESFDDHEEEFELTSYQKEFVCDFNNYVCLCCSRAVGKTVALIGLLIWIMTYNVYPKNYVAYFVPGKAQLDPVWNGLIRKFRTNALLKYFIPPNSGINSSEFRINLLNHSILLCRIAGTSGTGQNVIGLHTPFVIFDEGGYFPWPAFMEAQPILNTFTPGYRMMVSGVPNGMREKNVLYHCDQENSMYTKHRINSFRNPRFSEKDNEMAKQQYGGDDSEDYKHFVLGLHGTPVFALFDRTLMEIQSYPVYKLVIDGTQHSEHIDEYLIKMAGLPSLPSESKESFIGIDLGYTEPTAIFIMYKDSHGRLKFHAKIQLTKVSYTIQDRIIDILDTRFKPLIIGIDEGSAGKAVIQRLQESEDFVMKNFKKRMIPINFSSTVSLGYDSDGNEIKSKTKPFSISILQDYSTNHKLIFSYTDIETVTELERMTYSKNPSGDIIYRTLTPKGGKKGDDHFTSALLCITLAYYLQNEQFTPYKKSTKMAAPRWFVNYGN